MPRLHGPGHHIGTQPLGKTAPEPTRGRLEEGESNLRRMPLAYAARATSFTSTARFFRPILRTTV